MDIFLEIEKLIEYSIKNKLVDREDRLLVTNLVLECLELDTYREFSLQEKENIIKEIENEYLEKTLTLNSLSVIALTENLDYLFNDLNIFFNYTDSNEVTVKNVSEIMKRNNSKIFISDRWIKKEIINEIEKKGGKFLVLDTFNIPRELDGKMDPDGYIKGMKENMEKLVEAMQSIDKK